LCLQPLALQLHEFEFGLNSQFQLRVFGLDLVEFTQILFSAFDLSLEEIIAMFDFAELMVLIVEVVPEDGDEVGVGEVVEVSDELVIDVDVEEGSLLH
jgi:hypothetical protein